MTLQNAQAEQAGNRGFLSYRRDRQWLLLYIPGSQTNTRSLKSMSTEPIGG